MTSPVLITEDYRRLQTDMHRNPDYGVSSIEFAPSVAEIMQALGAKEVLDYGAGKGRLALALNERFGNVYTVHHYDPAVPAWSAPAQPCGLVVCIDVLEHVEPDLIDNVLDDLKRVTANVGFFTVGT